MGPKPSATRVERTREPETFPATVRTETFRPHAIARAITKRTLGPGAKMMIIAATMYSGRRVGITGSDYAQPFKGASICQGRACEVN